MRVGTGTQGERAAEGVEYLQKLELDFAPEEEILEIKHNEARMGLDRNAQRTHPWHHDTLLSKYSPRHLQCPTVPPPLLNRPHCCILMENIARRTTAPAKLVLRCLEGVLLLWGGWRQNGVGRLP